MTKEQEEAASQMREAGSAYMTACESLTYLEKKLGKVNSTVCDFRKDIVEKYHNKFSEKQKAFNECGGLDALAKLINDGRE